MRRLILSDIHSNLEALQAVVADATGRYDEVVCCGDVVGYNASPTEVIGWVRENARLTVRGNHDRACSGTAPAGVMNRYALAAALWTATELSEADRSWLAGLAKGPVYEDGYGVVHGSPEDEDAYLVASGEAEPVMRLQMRPIYFGGHTHLQGGWSLQRGGVIPITRPARGERERTVELDADYLYLINPGSVGQPRDRDPRAAYAIWDDEERLLRLRRVEYDVRGAQSRILEAGLPALLAERLATGH